MSQPLSRIEHIYLQTQAVGTYATIPHAGGVATLAATDACKTRGSVRLNYAPARTPSPDKQDNETLATLDTTVMGRKVASYSLPLTLRGSSGAGTPPDCHPALLAMFGKSTNTPATSELYELNIGNYPLSFALWKYVQEIAGASTVMQECAFGCLVNSARLAFGQDFASLDLDGPAFWVLSNDQYGSADADMKGGLGAFPNEPANQTYTGSLIAGFTGTATINGEAYTTLLKGGGADFTFNRAYDMSVWGTYMGQTPTDDLYDIRPYFTLIEDDSAAQNALRAAALARTQIDLSFQIGTTAGSRWTWAFNNVILEYVPERSDANRRWEQTFRGKAHSTNSTTRDEATLTVS